MNLSAQETSFIEKRNALARCWPITGSILMIVIALLCVWLLISRPLLVNPWHVLSQLRAESISESTLILMAAILPVAVLMCLVLTIVIILLGFSFFSKERKYIAMIHRLIDSQS